MDVAASNMDSSGALGFISSAENRAGEMPVLSEQETGPVPAARVTDPELFIRKAFETDPREGCSLLFRHYYAALCSHAARLLYSKTRAEDLVSEIFYQFYQKQTYLTVSTSYRAYLYKAVRHRAYNQLQAEINRSLDLTDYEHLPDAGEQQPDALMQYEELSQQVEAAINALPPQRQKIYLMHRFDDKKYADIAQELQLSVRTVEVQIRKASQYLRETIAQNRGLLLLLALALPA